MAAARRNLADARLRGISPETRFDVAHKAAMQCALMALMANGFRPSTNEPGHHATLIQSLPKTIGLPGERMIVLDQLRKKRNLSDYTGEGISEVLGAVIVANTEPLGNVLADIRPKTPRTA